MFEVQDQSDRQLSNAEVIEYLAAFVVGNSVDALGVHDDLSKSNQVRNELADALAFVKYLEVALLIEGNATAFELHHQ